MTTLIRPSFSAGLAPAYATARTFERSLLERSRVAKRADDVLTVAQACAALLTNIEPTPGDRSMASAQQNTLRLRLTGRIGVIATYLSGSYRRHTIIRPLDDIDVLVVLDHAVYPDLCRLDAAAAQRAIDLVGGALAGAYPNHDIKRFNRGVQIAFAGTGIGFDVVPVLQFSPDEFWMPDTNRGTWIRTNPRAAHDLLSAKNQDICAGWLVPLVKLTKQIVHTKEIPLSGYHVEAMVYRTLDGAPENERVGIAGLVRALAAAVLSPVPDLWPDGEPASASASFVDMLTASYRLVAAAERADAAVAAEAEDRVNDAHGIWHELFGDAYPETGVAKAAARVLSPTDTLRAIRAGAYVSATSSGLVAPASGYAGARSSTSHGGDMEPPPVPTSAVAEAEELGTQLAVVEGQIEQALEQFTGLQRIDPADAANDPALWPVRPGDAARLHAVLIGEQRSNIGGIHRILVTVPLDAPATEPRVYRLDQHVRHAPRADGRFVPRRRLRHQWSDGAMCTHARRDRWDGRLVTLLVYAADWLVRQDHYQRTGHWIGREIAARGHLLVNGRAPGARRPARRRGRQHARGRVGR